MTTSVSEDKLATALTLSPSTTCPPWCDRVLADHLRDGPMWEGLHVHQGPVWGFEDEVSASLVRRADGVADARAGSEPMLHFCIPEEMSFADAEDMARTILGFIESERLHSSAIENPDPSTSREEQA